MSTPQVTSSRLSTADILNILVLGFGLAITVLDPTLVSLNVTRIERDLDVPAHLIGFVGSIATLTLAAAVLGATSLGDLFGRKRLYVAGLIGTIFFDLVAVFSPNTWVLIAVRAGRSRPRPTPGTVARDPQLFLLAREASHGHRPFPRVRRAARRLRAVL